MTTTDFSTKIFPVEPGTLTLEEAADRLGLHYMTVYRYVRTGRLAAEYRGGRWHIRPEHLASATRAGAARKTAGGRPSSSLDLASERILDRLVAGDAVGAWQIVEQALMAGSPADVYLRVLGPCLRTIGDRWETGRLTVADEHRATAVAIGLVGRLSPMFGRPGRRRPGCVLLAGAEGDFHAIPLMMVADLLRAEGLDVIQLGADVPVATLVTMAGAADLTSIGLSASTDQGVVHAGRAITELHQRLPGIPVMLGGPAVTSADVARRAGADGWAPDAATAVDLTLRIQRAGEQG
jgi:excisionase family DNA binding protein